MASMGAVERFAAMGTRVELHVFGDGGDARDALATARVAVEAVDDALTIHRPSPATVLNEALMAGEAAPIDDPLLFDALVLADDGHAATFDLFDIAADARRGDSWREVTLDRTARRIAAARPLALDFGGMGKGLALDRAVTAPRCTVAVAASGAAAEMASTALIVADEGRARRLLQAPHVRFRFDLGADAMRPTRMYA